LKNCFFTALIFSLLIAGSAANASQQSGATGEVQQWLIVNYWSEWCVPCRTEIPVLNELNEQLAAAGSEVTVVGVDFDENPRDESLAIAQRMGINFPVLAMAELEHLQLKAPNVLPTTYIMSPDRQVMAKLMGEQSRQSLLTQLAELNLLEQADTRVSMVDIPLAVNSSLSRVVTDGKGGLYLSWVSTQGEMSSLSYARLERDVWQAPQVIAQGNDWFVNWADFPSLVVNEDTMAAHWLRKSAAGSYDYDVRAAFFQSASQSWSQPITVHKDGVSAEHGFVSMLPLSEGRTFIAWLDGRNTKSPVLPHEAGTGHKGHNMRGAMTVRAGIFDRDGKTLDEWQLDGRACDCCQTSAALAASGPVVVYRDRSDEEIRDIYITRLIDGRWSEPLAVYHDGWQIAGCPVNGPAVVAHGEQVAVAWFSARDDSPEVKLALSNDNGATFSAPVMVSGQDTIGRVGASYLDSGQIAVSWVDVLDETASVMLALYDSDGSLLERVKVAQTQSSRRSGFPVITSLGSDVYVSWTDISREAQVRLARVRF